MQTEKNLQDYIMKECKKRNILCHKMESRTSRGWPDLLLMFGGQTVFIEVKSPSGTGKLSPHQVRTIHDIDCHGGWTAVVDSKALADASIEERYPC
mgnify:FL=1